MLSSFLTRHAHLTGDMNRAMIIICASFKACMNSARPFNPRPSSVRHAGSSSKATQQMLSNAKRSRTSCMSSVRPSSSARESRGSSRSTTSNRTVLTTKFLNERLLNS
uniref:Uncharacterized protein n=1 Tax=Triticum urartu TaxID=4572 RepID=A0A8R7PVW7_TRIUA